MKYKVWLLSWLAVVASVLAVIGVWIYKVDPYFHYHKPDTEKYFYLEDNQRSMNDGIIRNFDYDAVITGSSLSAGIAIDDVNEIFDVNSIKVSYFGGSTYEVNSAVESALERNPSVRLIVRPIDEMMLMDDKDRIRSDLGSYPEYLYDENPFNDVNYLFNKEIFFSRIYDYMLAPGTRGFHGMITFDEYYATKEVSYGRSNIAPYGVQAVCDAQIEVMGYRELAAETGPLAEGCSALTQEEYDTVHDNIMQNVVQTAQEHPDVDFYYYMTPYGALWWMTQKESGLIDKQLEAEREAIELMLTCDNIHLYSFNNCYDIITDLNNYNDWVHPGEWVSKQILEWMKAGEYQLTEDNYEDYLEQEGDFYRNFDYLSLDEQE